MFASEFCFVKFCFYGWITNHVYRDPVDLQRLPHCLPFLGPLQRWVGSLTDVTFTYLSDIHSVSAHSLFSSKPHTDHDILIAYLLPNTEAGIMETKDSLSLKSLLIWGRKRQEIRVSDNI